MLLVDEASVHNASSEGSFCVDGALRATMKPVSLLLPLAGVCWLALGRNVSLCAAPRASCEVALARGLDMCFHFFTRLMECLLLGTRSSVPALQYDRSLHQNQMLSFTLPRSPELPRLISHGAALSRVSKPPVKLLYCTEASVVMSTTRASTHVLDHVDARLAIPVHRLQQYLLAYSCATATELDCDHAVK